MGKISSDRTPKNTSELIFDTHTIQPKATPTVLATPNTVYIPAIAAG